MNCRIPENPIADTAFKELIPAIIEAQGPVEAVSGATFTSKARWKPWTRR